MDKIRITLKNIALKGQPFFYAMVMKRGNAEILFPIGDLVDAKTYYIKCLNDYNLIQETWGIANEKFVA